ncbi:MAG: diaminopimelate decarboxylase family protein, partial [Alphaproteobacteria bacterium]
MTEPYPLEPWQVPGFLDARGGRLHMDGVDLVALAGRVGTPLLVFSESRIRRNARATRAAFGARGLVCYAAKACAHLAVLRAVRSEGLGIEVNSGGELAKARYAGFPDDAIVFNGVAKSRDELRSAMSPPIKAINVDSLDELDRIVALAGTEGLTANVALRFAPDLTAAAAPGNQTGSATGKFGLAPAELADALGRLAAHGNRVRLRGVHVHVGSQVSEGGAFADAARFALAMVGEVEARGGVRLDHVNLGGGFPLDYVKGRRPDAAALQPRLGADAIAAAVAPTLAARPDLEIVVEPGRAIVGDAAALLARVEAAKRRGDVPWLMLDAGYNVVLESFSYKWYFHALTANRADDVAVGRFRLAGPLCDSGDAFHDVDGEGLLARVLAQAPALATHEDVLRRALVRLPALRELPRATVPGDIVAFLDVGAYTLETMTPN